MESVGINDTYTSFYEESSFENVTDVVTEDDGPSAGFPRGLDVEGLVLGILLVILICVTNILSLAAFIVERRLRTYNNYFIINLVLADLAIGVSQTIGVYHTFLGRFPFSQGFCKVYIGVRQGLLFVSTLQIVVICIDRYRATYDPINHFISRNKRKAVIMNTLTWVVGLGFWLCYSTAWDFIVNINSTQNCFAAYIRDPIANVIQNVLTFFVPLAIICLLYFRIYIKIKASIGGKGVSRDFKDGTQNVIAEIRGGASVESSIISSTEMKTVCEDINNLTDRNVEPVKDKDETEKAEKRSGANRESKNEMLKANRTLSYIILSFIIAWLPNAIIYLLYSVNPALFGAFPREVRRFFVYLLIANSFCNPICYVVSQPLFRRTVLDLFIRPRKYCHQ
ncbi:5-hydroxytryptamine receptor 1F-like [Strongylocentrotus purpuratus]|uniref:G-protein coupled receptors family 1 profile domain-containing protein n=1 Tax=Strongylocentrotus purpuratus TaxID=7668 RepID=A0A7M7RFK5_STRPU|nr:5-hydroxytryptamine receptor 1F-like [Strongylocentrotus purpuratus]|eukprot:XP_793801.1 PREDICTED: 5-hydroxytryptamine receptor 1F-like [Strongylocentrotus purpuratus]